MLLPWLLTAFSFELNQVPWRISAQNQELNTSNFQTCLSQRSERAPNSPIKHIFLSARANEVFKRFHLRKNIHHNRVHVFKTSTGSCAAFASHNENRYSEPDLTFRNGQIMSIITVFNRQIIQ